MESVSQRSRGVSCFQFRPRWADGGVLGRNFPSQCDFFKIFFFPFPAKVADFVNPKRLYIRWFLLNRKFLLKTDGGKYSSCLARLGSVTVRLVLAQRLKHSCSPLEASAFPSQYPLVWGRASLSCWSCAARYEQLHFLYVKRGQDTLPLKPFSWAECPNCFSWQAKLRNQHKIREICGRRVQLDVNDRSCHPRSHVGQSRSSELGFSCPRGVCRRRSGLTWLTCLCFRENLRRGSSQEISQYERFFSA